MTNPFFVKVTKSNYDVSAYNTDISIIVCFPLLGKVESKTFTFLFYICCSKSYTSIKRASFLDAFFDRIKLFAS